MLYVLIVLCTCFAGSVGIIEDDDWWAADICRDLIGPPGKQLAQAVFLVTYVVYGRLAVL